MIESNILNNLKISYLLDNDKGLVKNILNNKLSFINFKIPQGSTYCPFHEDTRHKSAKVYEDEDGISRLYCYGQCQTQYTVYDYIKKILNKNPKTFLLDNYTTGQILEFIEIYKIQGTVDNKKIEYVKEKFQKNKDNIIDFIDSVYFDS